MSKYVKSPLNYPGGKYRLLFQIIPLFPRNVDTFVDLFCGGGNVGVNYDANKTILNDINKHVIDLLRWFNDNPSELLIEYVEELIEEYSLTDTYRNGYEYYGCHSSQGVAKINKEKYHKLRSDYNNGRSDIGTLYTLIIFAFNNQISFNQKGEFNTAVNKRDFNKSIRNNLINFSNRLKTMNIEFSAMDFRDVKLLDLSEKDFVYVDPPYFITEAIYNKEWSEKDELELYHTLDYLNLHNVKFALSNVFESKGVKNEILQKWSKQYNVHYLNHSYSNSNYQRKDRDKDTVEVLITNY